MHCILIRASPRGACVYVYVCPSNTVSYIIIGSIDCTRLFLLIKSNQPGPTEVLAVAYPSLSFIYMIQDTHLYNS